MRRLAVPLYLLVSLVPGQSTTGLVRRSAESAAPNKRTTKPVES